MIGLEGQVEDLSDLSDALSGALSEEQALAHPQVLRVPPKLKKHRSLLVCVNTFCSKNADNDGGLADVSDVHCGLEARVDCRGVEKNRDGRLKVQATRGFGTFAQ